MDVGRSINPALDLGQVRVTLPLPFAAAEGARTLSLLMAFPPPAPPYCLRRQEVRREGLMKKAPCGERGPCEERWPGANRDRK